jgi:UDP-N-acetylmuramoyl-tripeptide--D-alanyl-D-alanine ligase
VIARSSQWTPREVCEAVCGSLSGAAETLIRGIATDTRDELRDHLFVALRGERFDAHRFVDSALNAGASALLVESAGLDDQEKEALSARTSLVEVQNSLVALGDLAAAHRRKFANPTIALTGSNGKTTTKEMIASILSCEHQVLKTEGNYNNLIGLPMTLLGLDHSHELAVIEMGMNAPGEIARLTEITQPDVGLITNIGPAHIGMLGSLEALISAKAELLDELGSGAVAVVSADHEAIAAKIRPGMKTLTFGSSRKADVCLTETQLTSTGQQLKLRTPNSSLEIYLPYPGAHNAMNAAAAIAAVLALEKNISDESITNGLAQLSNVARRMELRSIGPYLVVDDCYNANGDSMVAAIETVSALAEARGARWVAVLGEMRELGTWSQSEHERVGQTLKDHDVSLLAAFGERAAPMIEGQKSSRHESEDFEGLCDWIIPLLEAQDLILLKGSRGTRMERFIERLQSEVG